jgi:hypothetical protein
MRPTKMLPLGGSLREFREPDSFSQGSQSQPQPNAVFSRRSKGSLTKKAAGLICWASFCAGAVFFEYRMLLLLGAAFVLFAAACALAVVAGVLYRAPDGEERADGLHIRQHERPEPFVLARSAGPAGFQELGTDKSLKSARM